MSGLWPWPLLGVRSLVLVDGGEVAHVSTHLARAWAPCVFLAERSLIWKWQQLFKSIMGPSLLMLSLTSVKVTSWPGKGYTQGGLLFTGHFSFLSTLEVESTWVSAKTSLWGYWCRKARIEIPHLMAGPCWPWQSKPGLDFVPNRSHLCGYRKWEPRWRPTQIFKDRKCNWKYWILSQRNVRPESLPTVQEQFWGIIVVPCSFYHLVFPDLILN